MDKTTGTTSLFQETLRPYLEKILSGRGTSSILADFRARAAQSFLKEGLPDRTWESWRNSDPSFLGKKAFLPMETEALVVVVPRGVTVTEESGTSISGKETLESLLAETSFEGMPFSALAAALPKKTWVVRVASGVRPEAPLILKHRIPRGENPLLAMQEWFFLLEEGSALTVLSSYEGGSESTLYLPSTRAWVGRGATLKIYESHQQDPEALQSGLWEAKVLQGARFEGGLLMKGGAWVRQDLRVRLAEKEAAVSLKGLMLARGDQHLDLHSFIDHGAPSGSSEQLIKSVVTDRAVNVYNGLVLVRENALKTDARQVNRNLALGDEAVVFSQPRLEIYADDVKCTHGSATGPLDENSVFYLRSRGISASESRKMLFQSFVQEVMEPFPAGGPPFQAQAAAGLDEMEKAQ